MNTWLEDAIEEHFFSDDEIELDEAYLMTLSDDDMLDLIWRYIKMEKAKTEEERERDALRSACGGSFFHCP